MAGESEGGGWVDEAWETVRQWVEKVWEWGVDLVKALVNTLYDMLFDVFLRIVDAVLTVVVGVIGGIGELISWNPAEYIGDLPSEVSNMIGLIGLGEATTIIIGAIIIRLLLQLIPFTRLGS